MEGRDQGRPDGDEPRDQAEDSASSEDETRAGAGGAPAPGEPGEANDPDFHFVLRELLSAYQPILEEELRRAGQPDELAREAESKPPNCDEEIELGNRIFEKFFTEEVALRLLPREGREILGPIERWRWCYLHLRCCILFGWLICRGPRSFRALVYYLYRYWICVRATLGIAPVGRALTAEEHADFQTLVRALADAYKPYLTDQLATVEFPTGLPDEVISGTIDCFEGEDEAAAVLERFLTAETAPALLGKEAFAAHSQEQAFWFCRCWCLCAIRFGCCLARARTFLDVVRCLRGFRRCLRDCFRPLVCDIAKPTLHQCADEQFFPGPNILGIEIVGTATGAFCDHYTLEWKPAGAPDTAYTSAGVVYPGGTPQGVCGKVNTTLGYLSTGTYPIPDSVSVRLCVVGTASSGQQECCLTEFEIFRRRVWISSIEGVPLVPNDVLDPTAQLASGGQVRSFGTALEILGRAWVGKCAGREIKRYTLAYQPGFVTDPTLGPWTQFWQVDYTTPKQQKAVQETAGALTNFWSLGSACLTPPCPPGVPFTWDELHATRWDTRFPNSYPVDPEAPPLWASKELPLLNCQSGPYTLRLMVEDTALGVYYDTQQVWFDNKDIYGEITGLMGIPPCATINLSDLPNAGDCTKEWPLPILGIAYDEYIIEGTATIPSDNFGGYCMTLTRQGGTQSGCTPVSLSIALPIPTASSAATVGTSRVGDPGVRCPTASPPPGIIPPKSPGILTVFDARLLDDVCAATLPPGTVPAGFPLKRGGDDACCAFYFTLEVWDTSICPSLSGGRHEASWIWPICICNDLPPVRR
jgi:hypothetical protein